MSAVLSRIEIRCDDPTRVSLYDGATWLEERRWAAGRGFAVYVTGSAPVLPLSDGWRESLHAIADRPGVSIWAWVDVGGGGRVEHAVRVEVRQ